MTKVDWAGAGEIDVDHGILHFDRNRFILLIISAGAAGPTVCVCEREREREREIVSRRIVLVLIVRGKLVSTLRNRAGFWLLLIASTHVNSRVLFF